MPLMGVLLHWWSNELLQLMKANRVVLQTMVVRTVRETLPRHSTSNHDGSVSCVYVGKQARAIQLYWFHPWSQRSSKHLPASPDYIRTSIALRAPGFEVTFATRWPPTEVKAWSKAVLYLQEQVRSEVEAADRILMEGARCHRPVGCGLRPKGW